MYTSLVGLSVVSRAAYKLVSATLGGCTICMKDFEEEFGPMVHDPIHLSPFLSFE